MSHFIDKFFSRVKISERAKTLGRTKTNAQASGVLSAVLLAICLAQPAQAQAIIRDAEIEQLMRDYLRPLVQASKIPSGDVKVVLIGDRSYNAFVADGKRVFVNIGALIDSTTPNQLIGVLAHEMGHIAGGHLARLRQELQTAQAIAVVGTLLGAAGAIGTMRSSPYGKVGADSTGAMGMILGPQEVARRALLAYQRSEEQAADQAAVKYLNATGQSTKGILETFKRFSEQSMFYAGRADPYLMSHPLPQDRIASLEHVAKQSPYFEKADNPSFVARHALMRAKLYGFVAKSDELNRKYPMSDNSLPARYARAINAYRFSRGADAQSQIDGLIREQPRNPYFWELKGQALLEAGRAREAIAPLRKAVALAPSQVLLRVLLGHALVSAENPALIDEAIKELTIALQRDNESAEGYRYLAQAYEKKGLTGEAELASAQGYLVEGDVPQAQAMAKRAQSKFKEGSPSWIKADDVLAYRPPKI